MEILVGVAIGVVVCVAWAMMSMTLVPRRRVPPTTAGYPASVLVYLAEDGSMVAAFPTGRLESREDGEVAEVFEIREFSWTSRHC